MIADTEPKQTQEIRFSGNLTRDEYMRSRGLNEPRWKRAFRWAAVILIAWGGWWIINSDSFSAIPEALIWLSLPAIILFTYGYQRMVWKSACDKKPELGKYQSGTINENGIYSHTGILLPWTEVKSWKAGGGILLVSSLKATHILPVSHFPSRDEWAGACALCAAKLSPLANGSKKYIFLFSLLALLGAFVYVGIWPFIVGGSHMESFCGTLQSGLSPAEVKARVLQQDLRMVYVPNEPRAFIHDPRSMGRFICQLEFRDEHLVSAKYFFND